MALIRTTLRIEQNLKKEAEKMALEQGLTLQYIFNEALRNAVTTKKPTTKKPDVIFYDKAIIGMPENLTRDDFYENPQ
jgi:hypothetical protein